MEATSSKAREGFVMGDDPFEQLDPPPAPTMRERPPLKAVTPEPPPKPEPEPPPDPAPPPDPWPLVVKLLHKPVSNGRELLNELSFREPSAGDLMRAGGNPCRIEITELSAGGQVVYNPIIDDAKMMRLMASLSGVLEPFLQKMDPRDYVSAAYRLRRFFLPEQGIW